MFACSPSKANTANPNSRSIACHVFTSRPSGVSRGVTFLTALSPPSDVRQDEAAALERSVSKASLQASPSPSPGVTLQGPPAYAYLITLMAGFSVIASDVNTEDSLHLLQPLDTLVHTTVAQNIPFDFRANIADKLISDTPIHTGAAMIVAGLAVIATTRPKQAAALAGLYSIFNFSCACEHHPWSIMGQAALTLAWAAVGGVGFGKDASATTAVKKFFHRARPSDDLHHSFSFPSGHSTSAYFTLAFLFFVIVPALASWSASLSPPGEAGSPESSSPAGPALSRVQRVLKAAAQPKAALALTIGGGMVTQSGRLLADVHWVSDVLAGAMWGSSGVALACVIMEGLRPEAAQSAGVEYAEDDVAAREVQDGEVSSR